MVAAPIPCAVPLTFPLEIGNGVPPDSFPSLVGAIPFVVTAPALTGLGIEIDPRSLQLPFTPPLLSLLLAVWEL